RAGDHDLVAGTPLDGGVERQRDLARGLVELGALLRAGGDQHVVRPGGLRQHAGEQGGQHSRQDRGDSATDDSGHDETFLRLRSTAPMPAPAPSAPTASPTPPSQRAVVSTESCSLSAALASASSCAVAAPPPWLWPSPEAGANSTTGAGFSPSGSSSAQLTVVPLV